MGGVAFGYGQGAVRNGGSGGGGGVATAASATAAITVMVVFRAVDWWLGGQMGE